MPPKKGKKKAFKKVISNALEEKMAEALMERAGLNTESEYGSELNPTPRESGVDDSFQDQSFQEHKEEDDPHNSGDKKLNLNQSMDNIDTKTTVTVEENKESKAGIDSHKNEVSQSDTNNVYETILREKEEKYKGDML